MNHAKRILSWLRGRPQKRTTLSGNYPDEPVYQRNDLICLWGCGFTGTFREVTEHQVRKHSEI